MNVSEITLSELNGSDVLSRPHDSFTRMMLEVGKSKKLRTGTPFKMGLSAAPSTWWPLGLTCSSFSQPWHFSAGNCLFPQYSHSSWCLAPSNLDSANRACSEVEFL